MTVTNRYYGGAATGAGKIVPDFGLCDLKGAYIYTAKARAKGLVVVTFFAPEQASSVAVLQAINGWTADIPAAKWTPIAVSEGDRESLAAFAAQNGIDKIQGTKSNVPQAGTILVFKLR